MIKMFFFVVSQKNRNKTIRFRVGSDCTMLSMDGAIFSSDVATTKTLFAGEKRTD